MAEFQIGKAYNKAKAASFIAMEMLWDELPEDDEDFNDDEFEDDLED